MPFIVLQSTITAATPWLASVAGVFALMALAARFIERKPRCKAISQFRRLGLFWQIAIVLSVGSATRWAGAKGDRGGEASPPEPHVVRGILIGGDGGQTRDGTGYTPLSVTDTPAFSNLAFCAIAATSTNVALAATWDSITNREEAIDVYVRTNLIAGAWGHLAEVAIDTASQGVAFDVPAEWLDGVPMAFFRLGSRLDSDGDGLPNDYETLVCGTNPQCTDTDGDGLDDGEELLLGANPSNADTDGDGMPDGWEYLNGLDPLSDDDAEVDSDGDGLTNSEEYEFGTDPHNTDTDGDGIPDGAEVMQGTDPTDRADTIPVTWVSVTGDWDMGQTKSTNATVTIPAGTTSLVGIFIYSEEYPKYTGAASIYNDQINFNIQTNGHSVIQGSVLVNDEDGAWSTADASGQFVLSFSPVVLKGLTFLTAPGGSDLPVSVTLSAKNVSDGALPSTAIAGFFPVKLVQANRPQGCGGQNTTDSGASYFREALPTNGIAYITGQPAAPQLTARIKGLPDWMRVTWSMLLVTERGDCRFNGIDDRELPPVTLDGDANYDITARLDNEIVGGRCRLGIRVRNDVYTVYPFFIRGKNPLDATAKAYIDANVDTEFQSYAWMIAKHESKSYSRVYNQYNPREEKKELPNYGPPHGWGIAQIDKDRNGDSTAEVYDWHVNVAAMNAKLREARNLTTLFLGYYSSAYSNLPNWTPPPSTNINGQVVSPEMWSILTIYNGVEGIPYQRTPTHNGLFRSPLQFEPSTGGWLFHRNSFNPNYVSDVVSDAVLQEVE